MRSSTIALILCSIMSMAMSQSWTSGTSGSWDNTLQWGGALPSATATIAAAGQYVVSINSPVSLLTSLTVGSNVAGTFPTLSVNGSSLTVPTLNLLSGSIQVINGSLTIATRLIVNTTGVVILNLQNSALTALGGVQVTAGQLEMAGQATLRDTLFGAINIAGNASLLLSGVTAAASCGFTGTGSVIVSGSFNLASGADCDVNTNAFVIAGAAINGTTDSSLNLAALTITGTESTVSGVTVNANTVNLVNGTISFIQGAVLNAEALNVSTSAIVAIEGNIYVSGQAYVNAGTLVLRYGATVINSTVAAGATLVLDTAVVYSSYIKSQGEIYLNNAVIGINQTALDTVIIGGQIYANTTVQINGGVTTFSQVAAQGQVEIAAGATVVLDDLTWTAAKINNTGRFILNRTVNFAENFYYAAVSSSAYFQNNGTVTATDGGIFYFSGSSNVEGTFNNGTLNLNGQIQTSADVNVNGALQIAGGVFAATKGNVKTTGNIVITGAAVVLSAANSTAGNISTTANLIVNSTARLFVTAAVNVGATLELQGSSVLNVTRGYVQAAALTMSASAKYAVQIYNRVVVNRILNVVGNAQLAGSIEVDIDADFEFDAGASAIVLTYGAHTGTFANLDLIKRSDDSIQYNDKNAVVTKGDSTPSSAAQVESMAFALLALLALFC